MASFGKGLILASAEYPPLFEEIGNYYERLIGRWLRYSERLYETDFGEMSNAELARHLTRWVDYYKSFSPILFVPFIVERRYADEYPALLDKLAEAVLRSARLSLGNGALGLLEHVGAVKLADGSAGLRDSVRGVLEHSPRRTIAEEKELCLMRLAAAIESDEQPASLSEAVRRTAGSSPNSYLTSTSVYRPHFETIDGWPTGVTHQGSPTPPRRTSSLIFTPASSGAP